MTQATLSLVMPTLNAAAHIEAALESVAPHVALGHKIEVVIADGGSQDTTRQIASRFPFVRILEGTDTSLYSGFNRGIRSAQHDIVGFLNADDWLGEGAVELVFDAFLESQDIAVVSGAVCSTSQSETSLIPMVNRDLTAEGILFGIPAINGRFFRHDVLTQLEGFRPDAGLGADREFLLRMSNLDTKRSSTNHCLYRYRVHAGSSTIAGDADSRKRVRRADLQLISYLKDQDYLTKKQCDCLDRFATLTKFRTLVDSYRDRDQHDEAPALKGVDFVRLPSALLAWFTWRGKLSGQ